MEILTTSIKAELLKVAQVDDVMMEGKFSLLLIATNEDCSRPGGPCWQGEKENCTHRTHSMNNTSRD